MARRRLPDLPDTGRRYVEHTARARLASPGLERFARGRGGPATRLRLLLLAAAVIAALVAAMVWAGW